MKQKQKFRMQEDKQEILQKLWKLQNDKELLKKRLESLNLECQKYENVLLLSNAEEFQDMSETILSPIKTSSFSLTKTMKLENYIKDRLNSSLNDKFQGINIRIKKDRIIFHFIPPDITSFDYHPPSDAILVFQPYKNTYRLQLAMLPGKISVNDLKEKFLQFEAENYGSFLHSIHHRLLNYWERHIQFKKVKQEGFMKDSVMYHNVPCTLITFTIKLLNEYLVELKLKYDSLSTLPYEISYTDSEDKILPRNIVKGLEDLKTSFLVHPLSDVLRINFANVEELSTVTSDSSETIIFDM